MSPPIDPRTMIPHRAPLLCIERVLEVDGERALADRSVAEGADVIDGELWEGGVVEGLTQTAAVLLHGKLEEMGHRLRKGVLAGIRGLSIARRPRRGERIQFEVSLARVIFPLSLVRCEVRSRGEVLASGEMKFFVEAQP